MNNNYLDQKQDTSKTGYSPNIQATTGTYCVTLNSYQSSGKTYPDMSFAKRAEGINFEFAARGLEEVYASLSDEKWQKCLL